MLYATHILLAFLTGLFLIPYLPITHKIVFFIVVLLFGSFPDVDHKKSTINRKIPLFKLFSVFFRHRGFIHSIFFALILFLIVYSFHFQDIAYGILIGFAAHLIGDGLTKRGIQPFYPFSTLTFRGIITTGGVLEKLFFYSLIFVIIYLLAQIV